MTVPSRYGPAWIAAAALFVWPLCALGEGAGVRAGDLLIHPSVFAGFSYDDNVFYEAEEEGPNSASVLNVGAGLKFENRNPNKLALRLDSSFRAQYLASLDEGSSEISDDVVSERNGLERVNVGLGVDLLPQSSVTLSLAEELSFMERPAHETSVAGFQRLSNSVGADLRFHPGPPASRALELSLGYRLHTLTYLEEVNGAGRAEKLAHGGRLFTRWKFLPKTALILDLNYSVIDYAQPDLSLSNNDTVKSTDRDSAPFRAELGVQGLLTNRVSIVLRGGYLNTYNAVGESFSGPVGQLQLQYVLEPALKLKAGYQYNAQDSAYSNYYTVHRPYVQAELFFLGHYSVNGRFGYDYYNYSTSGSSDEQLAATRGATDFLRRDDPVLRAELGAGYHFKDWLQAGVTWSLENNTSNYESPWFVDARYRDHASYKRQLVQLKVSANY